LSRPYPFVLSKALSIFYLVNYCRVVTSVREKEKESFAINGHESTDKHYEICLL